MSEFPKMDAQQAIDAEAIRKGEPLVRSDSLRALAQSIVDLRKFPAVKIDEVHPSEVVTIENNDCIADCYFTVNLGAGYVARRIAAALNATRHLTTEQLESADPLGIETACRLQREACAAKIKNSNFSFIGALPPNSARLHVADLVLNVPAPTLPKGEAVTTVSLKPGADEQTAIAALKKAFNEPTEPKP